MSTAPAPSIAAISVTKKFGRRVAVDNLTFHLAGPGLVGLVGPNGAGKTTLIRMLLGLTRTSGGRMFTAGSDPARLFRDHPMPIGYMPQREALYADLTARQNVAYFARLQRVPRAERKERVDAALRLVDMEERQKDSIMRLSGGMRRRVSLACALVHGPRLIFLDEPTVGLDPELRVRMWDAFRSLRDQGALLVVSTHYLAEAERCDDVVLLRNGHVIDQGAPRDLLKKTKTKDIESAFLALIEKGAEQ